MKGLAVDWIRQRIIWLRYGCFCQSQRTYIKVNMIAYTLDKSASYVSHVLYKYRASNNSWYTDRR
jgi:hypothetical protein